MPRSKRSGAYRKPRRGMVRGRSGRSYLSSGSFGRKGGQKGLSRRSGYGRKRGRVTRRKRTFGGRKRRGGYRKNTRTTATFKKHFLEASGQKFHLTRNIQSQFQIPLLNAATSEPTAQYMWPRELDSNEASNSYYTPWDHHDTYSAMNLIYGSGWYSMTSNTEAWDTYLKIAWKARYQVTNLSNSEVVFERLVFKVKRDMPQYTGSTVIKSLLNPLNVVGQYLRQKGDLTVTDAGDATNAGLHTERNSVQNIPAWNHWITLKNKKRFVLAPGKTKTHVIGRKSYIWKMINAFGDAIPTTGSETEPLGLVARARGDLFIMYKMISGPADINDGLAPLVSPSTRTVPRALLSYQVNYTVAKPAERVRTQFTPLPSHGIQVSAAANIVFMGNSDISEQKQVNAD